MWQSTFRGLQTKDGSQELRHQPGCQAGAGSAICRKGEAFVREERRCLNCCCVCWRTVAGRRICHTDLSHAAGDMQPRPILNASGKCLNGRHPDDLENTAVHPETTS
jgi:hypothetical protein